MPFRQRVARHFGDSLTPERAYLSYYDVCLTAEDVKSLKHDWLTDNNIAFWEEYLERETLAHYPQANIVLLRPSMTFLLMMEPDQRQVRAALPDFSKVTHIFLPINDNRNVSLPEGGSHWSLLLVSVIDGVAFHYDSLGNANYGEAKLATAKLSEVLRLSIRFIHLNDCPQQKNGSDCGVFVCLLMRHLLIKRLLSANAREKVSMSMAGKVVDSHGGRKEMLRIIEGLRKEGERRRSSARYGSAVADERKARESKAGIAPILSPDSQSAAIDAYLQPDTLPARRIRGKMAVACLKKRRLEEDEANSETKAPDVAVVSPSPSKRARAASEAVSDVKTQGKPAAEVSDAVAGNKTAAEKKWKMIANKTFRVATARKSVGPKVSLNVAAGSKATFNKAPIKATGKRVAGKKVAPSEWNTGTLRKKFGSKAASTQPQTPKKQPTIGSSTTGSSPVSEPRPSNKRPATDQPPSDDSRRKSAKRS
ncbi:hypothetical protein CDD80_3543 [Ophiocordyceps camponoti-rufipedis]|uniref:Ubiquitin-like protease family profile domain-containing protein n=1 Tax=Ophiocordyceps camponoti-rufipedis TaxID=2004952 RepID=A0A2C5Z201_9HYPO|nr:hypothetical protein CDD80_3543 [Ophiocordyceps camponoti-rufipedis]